MVVDWLLNLSTPEHWDINLKTLSALSGLSMESLQNGIKEPLNEDSITRIGLLVSIYEGIVVIAPDGAADMFFRAEFAFPPLLGKSIRETLTENSNLENLEKINSWIRSLGA